ncbi:MAG: hypothetical protein NVSMB65_10490 [Chloroflexota bacterium]
MPWERVRYLHSPPNRASVPPTAGKAALRPAREGPYVASTAPAHMMDGKE